MVVVAVVVVGADVEFQEIGAVGGGFFGLYVLVLSGVGDQWPGVAGDAA